MVNESFVRHYLANVDPRTQRILSEKFVPGSQAQGPLEEWQIVGVFRGVNNDGLRSQDYPEIDVPFWQSPSPQAEMAVRTASDPSALTRTVEDLVASVEPDLPLANARTGRSLVCRRNLWSTGLCSGAADPRDWAAAGFGRRPRTGFADDLGRRSRVGPFRLGLGVVGACLVGRALKSML